MRYVLKLELGPVTALKSILSLKWDDKLKIMENEEGFFVLKPYGSGETFWFLHREEYKNVESKYFHNTYISFD